MNRINFEHFVVSMYFSIIAIALAIVFLVNYVINKNKQSKIDIVYSYLVSIIGMGIGAKIFYLVDASKEITLLNFLNSGYSFIGGLVGSAICIYLYCKRFKMKYLEMQLTFILTYPLLYSISKIRCSINGCCAGVILGIPIQWIEIIGMFLITIYLLASNKNVLSTISKFLIIFGSFRFVIDYFRVLRNIIFYNITLSQIICFCALITGIIINKRKN